MSKKYENRIRRAAKTRAKIAELGAFRLSVHRTEKHIYAQIITPNSSSVLVSASTVEFLVRKELISGGNLKAAIRIGQLVAERAKKVGIEEVAFDRSGFKYHGRIKALAEAARQNGLKI